MHSSIEPRQRFRIADINGLVFTEFAQPPSMTVSKHAHESATILFTLNGFARDKITNHFWECNPGVLLVRPAGEPHTHQYGREGAHCLVIEVKPSKINSLRRLPDALGRVTHFSNPLVADLGLRICKELRIMDHASELALEGLFLEIMAATIRQNSETAFTRQPAWLSAARELIHESYTQHLSLAQVAAVVGVHPAYLAEVFRKQFGVTVGQYIRRLRLDHASRELLSSDKSLAEISAAAGFYDQSHFSKIFKRHTGIAPAKMRGTSRTSKTHTKSLQSSKRA